MWPSFCKNHPLLFLTKTDPLPQFLSPIIHATEHSIAACSATASPAPTSCSPSPLPHARHHPRPRRACPPPSRCSIRSGGPFQRWTLKLTLLGGDLPSRLSARCRSAVQKPKLSCHHPHPWHVANVSIIFDAPCLFYTNCFMFCLHFMAFLCIFRN
jgi:hypothetical protein